MSSLQDPEKSRERRLELVTAFQKMAEFGAMQGVSAVIIAGDLFDVSRIPASTRNSVLSTIRRHGGIKWFYLKGNHDKNDFLKITAFPKMTARFTIGTIVLPRSRR